jgi:hypothetical protein
MYDPYDPNNDTLIVMARGRIFEVKLPRLARAQDQSTLQPVPSAATLKSLFFRALQLSTEKENAKGSTAPSPSSAERLGVLTTQSRDLWAVDRSALVQSGNAELLHRIQRAHFVVCLDDDAPVVDDDIARALWHGGTPCNRWFDKV